MITRLPRESDDPTVLCLDDDSDGFVSATGEGTE